MLSDLLNLCFKYVGRQIQLSRMYYDGRAILGTYDVGSYAVARKYMKTCVEQFIYGKQDPKNDLCLKFKWIRKRDRLICIWLCDSLCGFVLVLKLINVELDI